jgi:hypothetical protein
VAVAAPGGVACAELAALHFSACGRSTAGAAYCWGFPDYVGASDPPPSDAAAAAPLAVSVAAPAPQRYSALGTGCTAPFALAVAPDTTLYGWGARRARGSGPLPALRVRPGPLAPPSPARPRTPSRLRPRRAPAPPRPAPPRPAPPRPARAQDKSRTLSLSLLQLAHDKVGARRDCQLGNGVTEIGGEYAAFTPGRAVHLAPRRAAAGEPAVMRFILSALALARDLLALSIKLTTASLASPPEASRQPLPHFLPQLHLTFAHLR